MFFSPEKTDRSKFPESTQAFLVTAIQQVVAFCTLGLMLLSPQDASQDTPKWLLGWRLCQNPKKFSKNLRGSFLDVTRVVHDFVLYGFSLWDNIRKAMDFVELE